jgi:ABC-type hemin transport system ATPase subunit
VLQNGSLVTAGTPDDVLDANLLSRAFDCPLDVICTPFDGQRLVVPRHNQETPQTRLGT